MADELPPESTQNGLDTDAPRVQVIGQYIKDLSFENPGVMGGQNSEIGAQTTDVLLESAYFKPQNILATSKKLELRTDASYRYERGADSYQNVLIAQRTYYAARQTLATAELAKRANLVSLYSALGGGLDRPR